MHSDMCSSASTQQRRSTSEGPLLCRDRPTKAAWLHPFTAWPAFLHYDSCGPYGGVHVASERAPEAVLATSYCWWQRGSTPRWGFHGLLPLHGVARCVAAARPRTQQPSHPAIPRSHANEYLPQPSQVARSSPPSPPTAAARWPEADGPLARPLPPPPASPPPADAPRARYACVAHLLMYRACACI